MWVGIPEEKLDGLRELLAGLPVKLTVDRRRHPVKSRVGVTLRVLVDARRLAIRLLWHETMAAVLSAVDWAGGVARPRATR